MTGFSLPRLQKNLKLVDRDGTPALTFLRWLNMDFAGAIERQEAAQAVTDERQDAADAALQVVVDDLAAAVTAIQALLGIVTVQNEAIQAGAVATNNAQATADEALASGTVSGFADNPSIGVLDDGLWVSGPQVDLTGVVAGDLTISGTGPLQDSDVEIDGIGPSVRNFFGEYRVVEIDGMTQTTVFTGSFSAYQSGVVVPATVNNDSAGGVSAFTSPRTSTGAISYRLDFRSTFGALSSLRGYLFARRAAP